MTEPTPTPTVKPRATPHTASCKRGATDPGCQACYEIVYRRRRTTRAVAERAHDAMRVRSIEAHFASERHRSGGCGPVCTFGDW